MEINEKKPKEDFNKTEQNAREPHEPGLGGKETAKELGQLVERLRDWLDQQGVFRDVTGARDPRDEVRAASAFFGIDINSTYKEISQLNQRVFSSPGDHLRSSPSSVLKKIPGLPKEFKKFEKLPSAAKAGWKIGTYVGETVKQYSEKVEARRAEVDAENLDRILHRPEEARARLGRDEFGAIDVAPDRDRQDLSTPFFRMYPDTRRDPL